MWSFDMPCKIENGRVVCSGDAMSSATVGGPETTLSFADSTSETTQPPTFSSTRAGAPSNTTTPLIFRTTRNKHTNDHTPPTTHQTHTFVEIRTKISEMTSMPFHLTRANLNSRRSQLHTTSTQVPTQTTPRSLYSDLISTRSQSITRMKETLNESKFTTLLAFSHSTKRVSVNYTTASAENTTSVNTVDTSTAHPPNVTGLSTEIATDHPQIVKDAYALGVTAVTMIILIVLGRSLWAVYRRFWPQRMRAPDVEETIPITVVAPPPPPHPAGEFCVPLLRGSRVSKLPSGRESCKMAC
ncbi:uncharacterized protein LOC111115408 isoform X1 [Crassostrea virginica]